MKILLIIWIGIFRCVAVSAATSNFGSKNLRDPFTSPEQEHIAFPDLNDHYFSQLSAKKIKQWQLQGILGNCYSGYWALMVSNAGKWWTLRLNESLEGYLLVAIDMQSITLQWSSPSPTKIDLHPPLIFSLVEKAKILQPNITTKS